MKTILLATLLGLFSLVTAQAGAVNSKCPVSGKDAKKDVDVPISFCCNNCKGKFDKAPADYLKVVATAEKGKCPLSGKAADEEVTSNLTVGVCCNNCAGKLKENPQAYLGKIEAK
ncbi:hypothetical protein OVA24_21075 [Luteolibacter sp. SL250]|uniref:hypothetical protein n=1 Tax=Luteolibacter sp. SL250 TaxID=2995170 RepID=UPI0022721F14|nr:hypothetical protein [Luteolibacter sp. SL250]WAC19715.1 hypothetical protein OVA24_21075 [Luteolibacter sp. SL250]